MNQPGMLDRFDPATETFTKEGTRNLPAEIFQQRVQRETLHQAEVPVSSKR